MSLFYSIRPGNKRNFKHKKILDSDKNLDKLIALRAKQFLYFFVILNACEAF